MDLIKGAVVIIYKINPDKRVEYLLLQHKNSFWTFVGGRIEDNDSTIEAGLQREIFEELGLSNTDYKLSDTGITNEFIYGNEKPDRAGKKGITYYYAGNFNLAASPKIQAKIVDLKWLSKEEVLKHLAFEDIKSKFLEVCSRLSL
ncbi:NUDIX domain-containing protein [candidate division WWE3 bacterium]|nr:NUDIX domain-containing protein [candidate division WWE3 bacterium]